MPEFRLQGAYDRLKDRSRIVTKVEGRQLAIFLSGDKIYACNNRCPHEGYPLSEGTLADGCILTCNWHNWKFDLEGGETLVGGDKLRRYPVSVDGADLLVDITDPPADQVIAECLENLKDSFPRHEYDRMAREIARLQKAGGDPLDAVRATIHWTHDRMEYGATHAFAATCDWLALRDGLEDDQVIRLGPVLESVGHFAWDTQRQDAFPFPGGSHPFDGEEFVAAIEAEDHDAAFALARGGLSDGMAWRDFEPWLARAALAHYQDFGHAAIYVCKMGQLVGQLGDEVLEPCLMTLLRGLLYASREDLIPEFRHYATARAAWDGKGAARPDAAAFQGLSVNKALDLAVSASGDVAHLYDALLGALSRYMLQFDLSIQGRTDLSVSNNINWLDFTHGLTFANAVRVLCTRTPALWPDGLLQMACFVGRNTAYVDLAQDMGEWTVTDPAGFWQGYREMLQDHGNPEYIVSAHLVKLGAAVAEEIEQAPQAPWVPDILAATNRFVNSPLKRKHVMRVARQSVDFVTAEG